MATWTTLTAHPVGGQITSEKIDQIKDDLDYLHTEPVLYAPLTSASNITTTSTTFVDLTGFTIDITTQGHMIEVHFVGRGNGTTVRFDIVIDGVSVTGDNDGVGSIGATGEFAIVRIFDLVADTYTIKIQWRVTSGTGTVYPAGLCQLWAKEF